MTKTLLSSAAIFTILSGSVMAQNGLTGVSDLDDRISDIQDAVNEDIDKGYDAERFGPLGVRQGWSGSLALSAAASSGNTDTSELSLAGRLTYGVNEWSHSFGFAGEYGESNNIRDEEKFYGIYEVNRYFTRDFYVFGTARAEYDNFASNRVDGFAGFGPGYHVVNNYQLSWRVQAGPGIRYLKSQAGASETEAGWIASSRLFYAVSDEISITNDTDFLGSSDDNVITNDLGANSKVTDTLSMRVSYRSEYDSDAAAGFDSTDNTLGLSLVVGF